MQQIPGDPSQAYVLKHGNQVIIGLAIPSWTIDRETCIDRKMRRAWSAVPGRRYYGSLAIF